MEYNKVLSQSGGLVTKKLYIQNPAAVYWMESKVLHCKTKKK
jgi:hypothetical protein